MRAGPTSIYSVNKDSEAIRRKRYKRWMELRGWAARSGSSLSLTYLLNLLFTEISTGPVPTSRKFNSNNL
jgi:hypothetical protein